MIRDITIGRYYEEESLIHKLDPRTKLLAALCYIVILFLIKNPWMYIVSLLAVVILYKLAKVPAAYFCRGLKGISVLLVFTFLFRLLLTPGTVLFEWGFVEITRQGILKAVSMTSRIALMITGASLLSYTSTPKSLADGLEEAFSFLEKIKIPIHEMAMIVMIAFRFIPIMIEELNVLMDAQAARGARFEDGKFLEKCRNMCNLLMPLFLSTVRKASDLAMAMEARGYTGERQNARMNPLVYKKADKTAYAVIGVYFCVSIAMCIFLR